MKQRSVLALLLFLSSTVVFGQLEKGNIFIGGSSSIGFSTEKYTYTHSGTSTESSKSTNFGFYPKVGYFLIDNLPVGLEMNVNFYKNKAINGDNESTSSDFTIGPFARYYFIPQEALKPMVEAYVGFGSSKDKSKYSSYTNESKSGVLKFGIGVGASYFVTDNVAFDLLIGYNATTYKLKSQTSAAKSTTVEDTSNKYTGIGVNIGVVVTIPKK
jgi:opacity protein-like surface antigen